MRAADRRRATKTPDDAAARKMCARVLFFFVRRNVVFVWPVQRSAPQSITHTKYYFYIYLRRDPSDARRRAGGDQSACAPLVYVRRNARVIVTKTHTRARKTSLNRAPNARFDGGSSFLASSPCPRSLFVRVYTVVRVCTTRSLKSFNSFFFVRLPSSKNHNYIQPPDAHRSRIAALSWLLKDLLSRQLVVVVPAAAAVQVSGTGGRFRSFPGTTTLKIFSE